MTEAKKEKDLGFHQRPAVEDFGESGDSEGLYKNTAFRRTTSPRRP